MLPATDKPLWCESRHCGGQQEREREREGEHNEFGTSLPVVLHNISLSCRMCTDMITVRAYQRIFQLDSSILPPFFFLLWTKGFMSNWWLSWEMSLRASRDCLLVLGCLLYFYSCIYCTLAKVNIHSFFSQQKYNIKPTPWLMWEFGHILDSFLWPQFQRESSWTCKHDVITAFN